ncbi:MAG: hypothetical protein ACM3O7_06620 [Acidobacteriota bacterium]
MDPGMVVIAAVLVGFAVAAVVPPRVLPGVRRSDRRGRGRNEAESGRARAEQRSGHLRGLLAAGLACTLAQGCVAIRLETAPSTLARYETGTLEVRVYETPGDRRRDVLTRRPILTELFALDDQGNERPLHWASEPAWMISAVEEGRYRLLVRSWVDAQGGRHPLGSTGAQEFDMARGANVRISVVMSSAGKAAENVVYGVAAVGILVLCAQDLVACLNN